MTNDRFNDDANPFAEQSFENHTVDPEGVDTDVYQVVRVPTSPVLARIKHETDPIFRTAIDLLTRHDDGWRDPDEVFEEAVGRRVKIAKAHLGIDPAGVPPEGHPIAEVIEDDPRVAWLNDWADDPVSAYSDRSVPEPVKQVRDALPTAPGDFAARSIAAYKGGEVTRRELESTIGALADDYDVEFDDVDDTIEQTPDPYYPEDVSPARLFAARNAKPVAVGLLILAIILIVALWIGAI